MFHKLHAVHNYPLSTQGSTMTSSSSPIKIVTSQASGDTSNNASMLQSSFPQGSILVVPHPTSPFHAVLPVFANTAVIMPPGSGGGGGSGPTSSTPGSTPSSQTNISGTTAQQAMLVSGSDLPSQQAITIDGRLLSMGTTGTPDSSQMIQLVQQAIASANVNSPMVQSLSVSKTPPSTDKDGTTEKSKLQDKASSMLQQASLQYKDYFSMAMPVYTMKVEDAVQLIKVSFESKAIEISGEVPIKKIEVDNFVGGSDKAEPGEGTREKESGNKKKLNISEVENNESAKSKVEAEKIPEVKVGVAQVEEEKNEVKEDVPTVDAFHGHSSADLMSAELLLSLTGNNNKDWSASPKKSTPLRPTPAKSDILLTSSPCSSGPQTPSSGRKRKQKPIASAKPPSASKENEEGSRSDSTLPSTKKKRARKLKRVEDEQAKEEPLKKRGHKDQREVLVGRSKQFTPEELLEILNIPPSKTGNSNNPLSTISASRASAKMEELKASRVVKPMKEYVIETDSDSSSSSSSSSRFTPNSGGSSSSSDSDSSSNEDSSESKVKTPARPSSSARGRNKGKARGHDQGQVSRSSTSDDSSSEEEDGKKEKGASSQRGRGGVKRGGGRGRARSTAQRGHVVSIPTRLLKKIKRGKKLKLTQEVS